MLVNNAGVVPVGPLACTTDAELEQVMATNVVAPMALTRELLPLLRRAMPSRVVNVGSMFGDIPYPLFAAYSASKFALRGLSGALRRELEAYGVGVTYAAPRATRTSAAQAFDYLVEPMQMRLDDPARVAAHIWRSVMKDRTAPMPKGPERLFVLMQRLLPRISTVLSPRRWQTRGCEIISAALRGGQGSGRMISKATALGWRTRTAGRCERRGRADRSSSAGAGVDRMVEQYGGDRMRYLALIGLLRAARLRTATARFTLIGDLIASAGRSTNSGRTRLTLLLSARPRGDPRRRSRRRRLRCDTIRRESGVDEERREPLVIEEPMRVRARQNANGAWRPGRWRRVRCGRQGAARGAPHEGRRSFA